jgi:hypothetical protein
MIYDIYLLLCIYFCIKYTFVVDSSVATVIGDSRKCTENRGIGLKLKY